MPKKGHKQTAEHTAKLRLARKEHPPIGMLGKCHTQEAKNKIGLASKGRNCSEEARRKRCLAILGELNPMKRPEVAAKQSASLTGKKRGPYSAQHIQRIKDAPVIHHRDFDHDNDLSENKRKMDRIAHNLLHRRSGRRGIIFVRDALGKGIISQTFYDEYLAYINQEDNKLSERVSEETTSEAIN